jgi:hypothetical protein
MDQVRLDKRLWFDGFIIGIAVGTYVEDILQRHWLKANFKRGRE